MRTTEHVGQANIEGELTGKTTFGGLKVLITDRAPMHGVSLVGGVLGESGPDTMLVHPYLAWIKAIGPCPLWTRHMLGVQEAERDRRRHARL